MRDLADVASAGLALGTLAGVIHPLAAEKCARLAACVPTKILGCFQQRRRKPGTYPN